MTHERTRTIASCEVSGRQRFFATIGVFQARGNVVATVLEGQQFSLPLDFDAQGLKLLDQQPLMTILGVYEDKRIRRYIPASVHQGIRALRFPRAHMFMAGVLYPASMTASAMSSWRYSSSVRAWTAMAREVSPVRCSCRQSWTAGPCRVSHKARTNPVGPAPTGENVRLHHDRASGGVMTLEAPNNGRGRPECQRTAGGQLWERACSR